MIITGIFNNNYIKRKQPYFQSNPIHFRGFDCSEDTFEIKNLYATPCPACARPMISKKQLEGFADDVKDKCSDELIQLLSKYDDYYREDEKRVVELIKARAQKTPEANISQIVNELYREQIVKIRRLQSDVINKIAQVNNNNNYGFKEKIKEILEKYSNILSEGEYTHFESQDLIDKLNFVQDGKSSLKERVAKSLDKLPDTQDFTFVFLEKNYKHPQGNIAFHLLASAQVTCEHVKPKSKGGLNNTGNYLAECTSCNSTRSDEDFDSWVETKPNFAKNFMNYIKFILTKLNTQELSQEYSDYPSDIIKTIAKETKGAVSIELPTINQEETQEKVEKSSSEDKLLKLQEKSEELSKEYERLEALIKKYQHNKQYKMLVQYFELKSNKESLAIENNRLSIEAEKQKVKIDRFYKKIAELEQRIKTLNTLSPESKEAQNQREKISKLKKQVAQSNIQELETAYAQLKEKLRSNAKREREINQKIQELYSQIDFPQDLKAQIEAIESEITQINQAYLKIRDLKLIAREKEDIIASIAAKESEISRLNKENQQIKITASIDEDVVSKYSYLTGLLQRVDFIQSFYTRNIGKKIGKNDNDIFDIAKAKIQSDVDFLIENNPSVKYQLNLETIETLTKEIIQAKIKLEKALKAQEEIVHIQSDINARQRIKTMQAQLKQLKAKLQIAQERTETLSAKDKQAKIMEELAQINSEMMTLYQQEDEKQQSCEEIASSTPPIAQTNELQSSIPEHIASQINALNKEIAQIDEKIEYFENIFTKWHDSEEFASLLKYIELAQTKKAVYSSNKEILQKMHAINDLKMRKRRKEEKLARYEEKLASNSLDKNEENIIKKKIISLRNDINAINIQKLNQDYSSLQEQLNQGMAQLRAISKEIEIFKSKIDFPKDIKTKIKILEKEQTPQALLEVEKLRKKLKKATELTDLIDYDKKIEALNQEKAKHEEIKAQLMKKYQ